MTGIYGVAGRSASAIFAVQHAGVACSCPDPEIRFIEFQVNRHTNSMI
jgi:hypothetical protein